jgi:hypothetical protein
MLQKKYCANFRKEIAEGCSGAELTQFSRGDTPFMHTMNPRTA